MVAFRDIHYLHDLFDRHCLVCIYGECRILFSLQFLYQRVFNPVESYRGLVSVDMIGERVRVTVMLDRDADRSFCGYLSRTFRKQKLQCVRVYQRRRHKEEYKQKEYDVCHRRHRKA